MAIKKKEDKKSVNTLPGDLDNLVHKAFTEQFLSSKYDSMFKDTKAEVLDYFEKSEDLEITQGEGFKTEYGSIILSSRTTVKIDKDKLAKLFEDGEIDIHQLLACVSTFKNEDLEKTLSSSVFNDLAEKSESDTFTFKATGDFKSQCEAQFDSSGPAAMVELKDIEPKRKPIATVEVTEEKITMKVDKKQIAKAAAENSKARSLSAAEKAKAAKARVSKKANASDDLDAILKGE